MAVNDLLYDRSGGALGRDRRRRRAVAQGLYAHPTTYVPSDGGLPSEFVNDLEEDAAGHIWAATSAGWPCSTAALVAPA